MMLALLPLHVFAYASLASAPPVEVTLYDANHKETYHVTIGRDGSVDDETRETLEHAFRCRRSEREHGIDRGLLAMIADVSERFDGRTIEYISAYRGHKKERKTSPHRAGIALDFRIRGVKLTEVRDYAWANFQEVGVGWYPQREFVHIDHRAGKHDTAWTEKRGVNHYDPSWARRVREKREVRARKDRTGA